MSRQNVTQVLTEICEGSQSAVNRLLPMVYDELKALAQHYLKRERPDHTLQATALVHEAYLRLVDQKQAEWQHRAHFFSVAAMVIRRILVDHARAHGRLKRGSDRGHLTLNDAQAGHGDSFMVDLLTLDEALAKLAELDVRQAKVVELRFFGGLSGDEVAEVLRVSPSTVDGDWKMARAWLKQEMSRGSEA